MIAMRLGNIESEKLVEKPFNSQVFRILSSRYCRYVLYSFMFSSDRSMAVAELKRTSRQLVAQTDHPTIDDDDHFIAVLIDEALPQLASVGAIDYDHRTRTVCYQPQPTLEEYAHHSAYQELPTEIVNNGLS